MISPAPTFSHPPPPTLPSISNFQSFRAHNSSSITSVTSLLLFWWSIYYLAKEESRSSSTDAYSRLSQRCRTHERPLLAKLSMLNFHLSLLPPHNKLQPASANNKMNKKLMLMNQKFNYFNRCSAVLLRSRRTEFNLLPTWNIIFISPVIHFPQWRLKVHNSFWQYSNSWTASHTANQTNNDDEKLCWKLIFSKKRYQPHIFKRNMR